MVKESEDTGVVRFRVWITTCHEPETVIALEPAEEGPMSAEEAADAELDRAQKKPATRLLGIGAPRALTAGVSLTPRAVSLARRRQRGNRT